jgi:hypothetical protein
MISRLPINSGSKIGYCLSEVVKKELRSQWDKKYAYHEVKSLKLDFANNFFNQPPKNSRMARLGAVEYKHIMSLPNCSETTSRRLGDNAIINSYEFFRDKCNVDICFISENNNFAAVAHEEKMQATFLRPDFTNGYKIYTTWEKIVDLLYCASVIFGYIEINGIELHGIWKGKIEEHWDNFSLSVEAKNNKRVILRDLKIVKMMANY